MEKTPRIPVDWLNMKFGCCSANFFAVEGMFYGPLARRNID